MISYHFRRVRAARDEDWMGRGPADFADAKSTRSSA